MLNVAANFLIVCVRHLTLLFRVLTGMDVHGLCELVPSASVPVAVSQSQSKSVSHKSTTSHPIESIQRRDTTPPNSIKPDSDAVQIRSLPFVPWLRFSFSLCPTRLTDIDTHSLLTPHTMFSQSLTEEEINRAGAASQLRYFHTTYGSTYGYNERARKYHRSYGLVTPPTDPAFEEVREGDLATAPLYRRTHLGFRADYPDNKFSWQLDAAGKLKKNQKTYGSEEERSAHWDEVTTVAGNERCTVGRSNCHVN